MTYICQKLSACPRNLHVQLFYIFLGIWSVHTARPQRASWRRMSGQYWPYSLWYVRKRRPSPPKRRHGRAPTTLPPLHTTSKLWSQPGAQQRTNRRTEEEQQIRHGMPQPRQFVSSSVRRFVGHAASGLAWGRSDEVLSLVSSLVVYYQVPGTCFDLKIVRRRNPFRTAVPFWGHNTQIPSHVSPIVPKTRLRS